MISPLVQSVLDDNHFEVVKLLRYGPRFASIRVKHQERDGLFKISLPRAEQEQFRPADYYWTEHDTLPELDKRLVREALILQYLSQELRGDFEPQIITLSMESPSWSLRTYINEPSFDLDGSDHAFRDSFFTSVSPLEVVNFFKHLHQLSPNLPETISILLDPGDTRALDRTLRKDQFLEYCRITPELKQYEPSIESILERSAVSTESRPQVLTHGEAYAPHFFLHNNQVGLIDWENASFHDPVHDLAVAYSRFFVKPAWQSEFRAIVENNGYLDGDGLLQWDTTVLNQCIYFHRWLKMGNTLANPDYDSMAMKYFQITIEQIALSQSRDKK